MSKPKIKEECGQAILERLEHIKELLGIDTTDETPVADDTEGGEDE